MNLISVSSALAKDGVSNPDFVGQPHLGHQRKTFKMIDTNGTFSLDATPAAK